MPGPQTSYQDTLSTQVRPVTRMDPATRQLTSLLHPPTHPAPPPPPVKVRLQAQVCSYSGPWQCFTSIVRQEGFRGLYRGLSSPLIGGALETGVNYAVFQHTMGALDGLPTAASIPLAAATAGVFLSVIVSPAELIKCRMQLGAADKAHAYEGPIDCIRQLLRSEGYKGLTRGLGATMSREIPGNAVYFGTYMTLRDWLPGKRTGGVAGQPRSLWQTATDAGSAILCGAASGMLMWATVLPLDVAKTRIQTAWPGSEHDVGILKQLRRLYKEGGRRSLYAGLTPTLVRAAPANAMQVSVGEESNVLWCCGVNMRMSAGCMKLVD